MYLAYVTEAQKLNHWTNTQPIQ